MSGDFSQTWINQSKDPFTLQDWGCTTDIVLGTTNTSPTSPLPALTGKQSLVWSQALSSITAGLTDGWMIWQGKNGHNFGINIHVPLQEFGLGTAPYWQIMYDGGPWGNDHTSEPFTFPTSMGYGITVVPTAGHASLYLTITITNL